MVRTEGSGSNWGFGVFPLRTAQYILFISVDSNHVLPHKTSHQILTPLFILLHIQSIRKLYQIQLQNRIILFDHLPPPPFHSSYPSSSQIHLYTSSNSFPTGPPASYSFPSTVAILLKCKFIDIIVYSKPCKAHTATHSKSQKSLKKVLKALNDLAYPFLLFVF